MPSAVTIRVNRSEMDRSLRALSRVSDRIYSQLVNQAAYRANQKAVRYAPIASAEKIASELGVETRVGRKGQVERGGKTWKFKGGVKLTTRTKNNLTLADGKTVPMVVAILMSRAAAGKPFRYRGATFRGPKGLPHKLFVQNIRNAVKAFIGVRIKSRAYFKACFATIRDIMKRAASGKIPFSDAASRGSGTVGSMARDVGRIANATPATPSQGRHARATFEIISPRHDIAGAVYKYAQPALQRGFDEEARFNFKKAWKLELRQSCKALGIRTA